MQDIERTIIAQYSNSPRLRSVIERFNDSIDIQRVMDIFYRHVWNIETATGWGLDVWGRIVGIGRSLRVTWGQYWGFAEADDGSGSSRPFNDGIFFNDELPFEISSDDLILDNNTYHALIFNEAEDSRAVSRPFNDGIWYRRRLFPNLITTVITLDDYSYRKLILAKAAANISGGSIAEINSILMRLYGSDTRRIWLTEKPMSITVHYNWRPSPIDAAILENSGVFPRPTGVSLSFKYTPDKG